MNPIAIETINADLINAASGTGVIHAETHVATFSTPSRPVAQAAPREARLHMWRKFMLLRAIDDVRSDYFHRQANRYARHHRAPVEIETQR